MLNVKICMKERARNMLKNQTNLLYILFYFSLVYLICWYSVNKRSKRPIIMLSDEKKRRRNDHCF